MQPKLVVLIVAAMLLGSSASVVSIAEPNDAKRLGDLRYLLVRRAGAGGPEKNYYELSRTARFLEPRLFSDEIISRYEPSARKYGFDVKTEHSIRYGVYQAWKVRLVGTSDSQKAPMSTRDAVYVLIYPRNPDWKFCAIKYGVVSANTGGKKITYTDFQDGREYNLEVSPKWPRPWQIYEIEIVNSNAFLEIWQASKRPDTEGH
jgi:hypothetical protein